jgi:hypothetical protein
MPSLIARMFSIALSDVDHPSDTYSSRSIHLLEAMKQIVDLGVSIGQLNSAASRMMTVLLVLILQRTILGKESAPLP